MSENWNNYLEHGENLLWSGKPSAYENSAHRQLKDHLIGVILLVAALSILIFRNELSAATDRKLHFELAYWCSWILLPFSILVTLSPRLARFMIVLRNRSYALTNKRALIANSRKTKIIRVWELGGEVAPWREPSAVIFGVLPKTGLQARISGVSGREYSDGSGFEMIPDSEAVFQLAMDAHAKAANL